MEERLNIWFDEEGAFLEIGLEKGFFRDIGDDIWERIDENGNIGVEWCGLERYL